MFAQRFLILTNGGVDRSPYRTDKWSDGQNVKQKVTSLFGLHKNNLHTEK